MTTLLDLGTSKIRLAGKNSKTIPVYKCEVAKKIVIKFGYPPQFFFKLYKFYFVFRDHYYGKDV